MTDLTDAELDALEDAFWGMTTIELGAGHTKQVARLIAEVRRWRAHSCRDQWRMEMWMSARNPKPE